MSESRDERYCLVEEILDHAKEILLFNIYWRRGKKIQNNIHNPVSKLRLVLQSNLFEPGVIILSSNGKGKKGFSSRN